MNVINELVVIALTNLWRLDKEIRGSSVLLVPGRRAKQAHGWAGRPIPHRKGLLLPIPLSLCEPENVAARFKAI